MATYEYELDNIPKDARDRELWLQHAAGLIYFEDARQYAINRIDGAEDEKTRANIVEGINDALYGIMMINDGVTGHIENSEYAVNLETKVNLIKKSDSGFEIVDQVKLIESDGMCMAFHGWLEDGFGEVLVATKKDENT